MEFVACGEYCLPVKGERYACERCAVAIRDLVLKCYDDYLLCDKCLARELRTERDDAPETMRSPELDAVMAAASCPPTLRCPASEDVDPAPPSIPVVAPFVNNSSALMGPFPSLSPYVKASCA